MAEQKKRSQAQKAASAAKSKTSSANKKTETAAAKQDPKKPLKEERSKEHQIPTRLIACGVFLVLFVLLLVIALNPEGALVGLFYKLLLGLVGKVAFYVAIPAMLYLFFIHASSGDRPVVLRSVCVGMFVILCGCVSHLVLAPSIVSEGFSLISALYEGGMDGSAAGIVCGLVAMLFTWACGPIIPYIIFIIAAIFFLLGAMRITVPSIIRAVKNRPRADWEKEPPKKKEPAEVVVNHIAIKRIEHVEQKRKRAEQIQEQKKRTRKLDPEEKLSDMMRQIDCDPDLPVSAAGEADDFDLLPMKIQKEAPPVKKTAKSPAKKPKKEATVPVMNAEEEPIEFEQPPAQMPEFKPEQEEQVRPAADPVSSPRVVKPRKVTAKEAEESAAQVAVEIEQNAVEELPEYLFPPIELLRLPVGTAADGTSEMRENSRRLNETLASFKIEAHIINVTRGPSVTRYEVELEKGVRLSKLTTAADDIALSLGASGVRIAAVPGKISVVGIEVPNRAVTTVSLREVIDSADFSKARSKSSFAVGKDISGNCIVGNIAKLPHMLIAGTTGSGKSVCMNSIIISLLYKASPDDVKLIMVDPKMVELGIYNGIPHLLIPVVTDPKKAAGSLQWAVTEMMRRYKAMSDAGVRDLAAYNSIMENDGGKKLPQVVVIIDELADLMLVAAKEVEESICRIAQMGRASGIHLVIATQRPSADVITGLMKANIPSRIAFAVASAMESRIILDTQGAEKLVGRGDMLFAPIGSGKPKRVQGCFVTDEEVEAVATFVKDNYSTTYDQSVIEEIEKKAAQTGTKGSSSTAEVMPTEEETAGDEMLPAAVDVILETGQASVSMLQRRLKLGYARAARIVDEMEERGIVGPFQGSKPRSILVTKEQWEQMRNGKLEQMDIDDLEVDGSDPDGSYL